MYKRLKEAISLPQFKKYLNLSFIPVRKILLCFFLSSHLTIF